MRPSFAGKKDTGYGYWSEGRVLLTLATAIASQAGRGLIQLTDSVVANNNRDELVGFICIMQGCLALLTSAASHGPQPEPTEPSPPPPDESTVNVKQFAEEIHRCQATIRRRIKDGTIEVVPTPDGERGYRISRSALRNPDLFHRRNNGNGKPPR